MTRSQAIAEWRECIGLSYRGDRIAQHESWLNFCDILAEEGRITQHQRDNWSSPVKAYRTSQLVKYSFR